MKRILLMALVAFGFQTAQAQLTGLSTEVVEVHTGEVGAADLTGYTTYRLFANLTNPDDFVSGFFGQQDSVFSITPVSPFYQTAIGSSFGYDINEVLFTAFPELAFDSWLTIGAENNTLGGNWLSGDPSVFTDFEANGGGFATDDGIFYLLNGQDDHGIAGSDLKVLLGQFTVQDGFEGCANILTIINGEAGNTDETRICFTQEGSVASGCTDPTATNFDPLAVVDNGFCTYECQLSLVLESTTSPACVGDNEGSMLLSAVGQQGSVSFNVEGSSNITGVFGGLQPGTYTVMGTDVAGCTAELEVVIPDATPIVPTTTISSTISCNGLNDGEISVTAEGGAGDYTYSIDCVDFTNTTGVFTGLGNGFYTFCVQDGNGCEVSSEEFFLTQPGIPNLTGTGTPASCFNTTDGEIIFNTTGGTGDILVTLDGETVTSPVTGLEGGLQYFFSVTDENGCSFNPNPIFVGEPDDIVVQDEVTDVVCPGGADGSIQLIPTGGAGGFTASINGGEFTTADDFFELGAGEYEIIIQDADGCMVDLEFDIEEPDAFEFTDSEVTDISCNGENDGSIIVDVDGGNGGETCSFNGGEFGNETEFTDLAGGDYTLVCEDQLGCTAETTFTVIDPDPIDATAVVTEVSADGEEDGSIEVTVTGGTEPFEFDWTGPNGFTSDDEDLFDIEDGAYVGVITDANGCTFSVDINVTVGIEELNGDLVFSVSPNPTADIVILSIEGINGERMSYVITDATGRVIADRNIAAASGVSVQRIDLGQYADGMYYLTVKADNYASTVKVLKH